NRIEDSRCRPRGDWTSRRPRPGCHAGLSERSGTDRRSSRGWLAPDRRLGTAGCQRPLAAFRTLEKHDRYRSPQEYLPPRYRGYLCQLSGEGILCSRSQLRLETEVFGWGETYDRVAARSRRSDDD